MFETLKSKFLKLKNALASTQSQLVLKLRSLFTRPFDDALLLEIEQTLYEADLGSESVDLIIKSLKHYHLENPRASQTDYIEHIKSVASSILAQVPIQAYDPLIKPYVILVCGVNGSGKTTTCAKLAQFYKEQGLKVLLGAADTFRAAAIDQLIIWSEKLSIPLVKGMPKGDPASVVFDTIQKAKTGGFDIAIIDTAGRLESKTDLMHELEKIRKTAKKIEPNAPHATYLVLDATIGQTASEQTRIFNQYTPLTGLILTKLDGTAKGGVILSIVNRYKIPVAFVGTGEKVDDFAPFDTTSYLEGIFAP